MFAWEVENAAPVCHERSYSFVMFIRIFYEIDKIDTTLAIYDRLKALAICHTYGSIKKKSERLFYKRNRTLSFLVVIATLAKV